MAKNKTINYSEIILSGIIYSGIFIFFAFFYNSHLHFIEQFQLFLLTGDFFIEKLELPGGFSGYIGGFLTQFYYMSYIGPVIITALLLVLQLAMKRIFYPINNNPLLYPLSFIPALMAGLILCNEYYPLSAVTGFLLSMISVLVYMSIRKGRSRFLTGLILIPVTYWLAGGSYISLLLVILVYELLTILKRREPDRREGKKAESPEAEPTVVGVFRAWYLVLYLLLAAGIPLVIRYFIVLQPVRQSYLSEFYYNIPDSIPPPVFILFALPALLMILVTIFPSGNKNVLFRLTVQIAALLLILWLGLRSFANFRAEETMTYDYLVRKEKWDDVLSYANKKPPRNYLSLAMLNLSLAKKGQLGNRMFHYDQHGINGLFLPFEREYVSAIMGNEVFYHLGLTNASQQYAFESMETIPSLNKSVRVIKRLAETNLINAQYRVAEKYLGLLEKTLFYNKWADDTRTYLDNEEKINNHSNWGEKRRFSVRNDYFFHVMNMEAVLTRMVKEHPENIIAFEYLMAFYLINKDLGNYVNYIPVMERMAYREVPVAYQEAVLFAISLNNQDPFTNSPPYISRDTKLRMSAYAEIYSKFPDAVTRLRERFSDTYWFYFHFVEVEYNAVEERKNNTGST